MSSPSISNILDEMGVSYSWKQGRGRCRCPIHKGNNPYSFSFTKELWICHSCGAKGNAWQLEEQLGLHAGKTSRRRVPEDQRQIIPSTKEMVNEELDLMVRRTEYEYEGKLEALHLQHENGEIQSVDFYTKRELLWIGYMGRIEVLEAKRESLLCDFWDTESKNSNQIVK